MIMDSGNENQLTFNFLSQSKFVQIQPLNLKRAVISWLIARKPTGIGVDVPTRISKYKADAAAFWSIPLKKKILKPERTAIVEIRNNREMCWPDCSEKEKLLPLLRETKELQKKLQFVIREEEPELKDPDTLFDEIEIWSYEKSKNKEYHKCCRQLEEVEHALYRGSRFEQIRRAHVADLLYLAVPENSVHPDELADGWGLLFVNEKLEVSLVKEAENWNCPEANRHHLIQNMAMASTKNMLFAHGINYRPDDSVVFTPVPRRRRGEV
jgi:hypothetical protein